ncbi:MAG TPA: hypothetical protein VJJ22_03475 [Candidatus Paceibacterota bacterium]
MNDKMCNLKFANPKFLVIFLLFTYYFSPITSFAARLYFVPAEFVVEVGQTYSIDLMLDPEGEDINAVEVDIDYSEINTSFINAPTGKSIISLWVESPHIKNTNIYMAGVMSGGFSGFITPLDNKLGPGIVTSLVFRPQREGTGSLDIKLAKLIKNDGKGSVAKVEIASATVSIVKNTKSEEQPNLYDYNDDYPPDVFMPVIIKSTSLYDGKYTLIFHTNDADSGVEHYEVREGEGDFHRASSPYLLEDQKLGGIIYVRAIDFAGNARTVDIDPKLEIGDSGESVSLIDLALVVFFILVIIIFTIWLSRRRPLNN